MKVLVVSHTYITPINREKWTSLAQQFSDVTIDVVFPDRWPSCLFDHVAQEPAHDHDRCRFHAIKAYSVGNEVRYWYSFPRLIALLRQVQPTIIHVEQGMSALSYLQVLVCARLLGIKAHSLFFTWVNWEQEKSWSYYVIWQWIERINRSWSDGAITGNRAAQDLIEALAFDKPIVVIPQIGVNPNFFTPALLDREQRQKQKTIAFVGRFVAEKGIFVLLEAFNSIAQKHEDSQLLFIGKGPERDNLAEAVNQSAFAQRVLIKDAVAHDELAALYRTFDIFVLPSCDTPVWREQFGHVLIEAMASGIPIIGSDAGEIPRVIGKAGIICKQNNSEDLASKLDYLIHDIQSRQLYAARGRQRVQEHFTHAAIAKKTYEFWKQLQEGRMG